MYKDYKRSDKNGYVVVNIPDHPKAFDPTGDKNPDNFVVYEHVLIAEELIDRPLKEGEVVHHLDFNRGNNSHDNLLVMLNPMHGKLHGWLNKHTLIPNEQQSERIDQGCVRCKNCEKPIPSNLEYCSHLCYYTDNGNKLAESRGVEKPKKETLEKEVFEIPMTKLGEKYGVSDNAVRKWCKAYEIDVPSARGYWTKKKFNKL